MQFKPIINQEPTLMDARIFAEEPMNIRAEMLEMPMSERLSFDPDKPVLRQFCRPECTQ
jgi:propionate CoA-transferase